MHAVATYQISKVSNSRMKNYFDCLTILIKIAQPKHTNDSNLQKRGLMTVTNERSIKRPACMNDLKR